MSSLCVVVADGSMARLYTVKDSTAPRAPHVLVECDRIEHADLRELGVSTTGRPRTETNTNRQAGPVHPIGAQRERHRIELTRRYAAEVAGRAAAIVAKWPSGTLMLIAEPRLLAMMCETARQAVGPGVRIKELAKDFGRLSRPAIQRRLEGERALA